ncbi:MAG: hypothetical protein ACRC7B_02235, partial [Metamycoplasmataceae bacterium]
AKTDPTIISTDIEGDSYKSLRTLQKLFNGITQSDLNNITVTKENISGSIYVITLKANDGYTIGGQSTLKSAEFTLSVELDIKAKILSPYEIKSEDVDNDAFKSYATLQKLFEFDPTITETILNEAVVVTMTPMTGNDPRIITLTANKNYAINGMSSLDSNNFIIPINYIIEKASTVPTDIKPSDITLNKYKMWSVVSKLFAGLNFNEEMLVNLDIELITITVDSSYQIKLTPLTNYEINGGSLGITSDTFTVSVTNIIITNIATAPIDITLGKLEDSAYIQSIEFLNKLFNLGALSQTVIDNVINVEFSNVIASEYIIKLTSKSIDYRINGQTMHESNSFTIAINIDISKIDPVIEEISTFDTRPGTTLESLNTLKKVFNINIDQSIIDNGLEVTFNPATGNNSSITLTAKPGYIINDGIRSIQSSTFPERIGIAGTPRMTPLATLNENDIANLHSLQTLGNFFDGLTAEILANNITSKLNTLENGFYTITLRANEENLFQGGREITSVEFKYNVILNVSSISPVTNAPTRDDINPANLNTMTTLNKLFWNLPDDALNKLTAEIAPGSNTVVRLRTKDGYVFTNLSRTISSVRFTPQN